MKRAVLVDSSAILAVIDADDANHAKAVSVLERLATDHRPLFITNYIEAEAHALLLARLGRVLARRWLLEAKPPVIRATAVEEEHALRLITEFDDKDWSYCDALSFAVMEHRRMRSAFSFDHHFAQVGRFEVLGLVKKSRG